MILRKLIIENFRQLAGRGELRFAPPGNRNVTIILGQNGAGITTLLNAFLWCLYGEFEAENKAELVCHKAAQDTPAGGRVAVEVTLITDDGTRNCTITRRAEFVKQADGQLEAADTSFRVDAAGADGVTRSEPDPRQFVQQLLPQGLSSFFFFRGEDMEDLAQPRAEKRLKEGVEQLLDFTLLDRAIDDLKKVGKEFDSDIARRATDENARQVNREIEQRESALETAQHRAEQVRERIAALQGEQNAVERRLEDFTAARPFLEQRSAHVALKDELERQEAAQRQALASALSRDGFLWLAAGVLEPLRRLTNEAIRRDELPAKIKPSFVQHLLDSGDCVCGRPLDAAARDCLGRWGSTTGLGALEDAVLRLHNASTQLATRQTRLRETVGDLRTTWSLTRQRHRETVGQISACDSELQGKDYNDAELRALQNRRNILADDLIQHHAEQVRADDEVQRQEAALEDRRAVARRINKDHEQTKTGQRRSDAARSVLGAFTQMRTGWLTIIQEYLDGQLKRNWQRVAQLERLVEFTPQFRLIIRELGPDNRWTTSAPSSANLRALALSFVAALIKLAHDIHEQARQRSDPQRGPLFQGGVYPLVMDAPFATMDKEFKRKVPAGLKAVVPQMIVLSNYDQWTGEVDAVLRASVGALYVLQLHVPGTGAGSAVEVRDQRIAYVTEVPDATTDWSEIREVSL